MAKSVSRNICTGPRMINKDKFKNTGYVSKKELPGDGNVYSVKTYIDGRFINEVSSNKDKTKAQIKRDMEDLKASLKRDGINFDYEIVKHHVSNEVYSDEENRMFIE